jgi:hypothetical protein
MLKSQGLAVRTGPICRPSLGIAHSPAYIEVASAYRRIEFSQNFLCFDRQDDKILLDIQNNPLRISERYFSMVAANDGSSLW